MKEKFSFYLQKKNSLFNKCTLAICYKADADEIKQYGFTSENVVAFVVNDKLCELLEKKEINYFEEIKKVFHKKEIFMRIQCECLLGMYGDTHCDCEQQRLEAIEIISRRGGIYIHLPQEGQRMGIAL